MTSSRSGSMNALHHLLIGLRSPSQMLFKLHIKLTTSEGGPKFQLLECILAEPDINLLTTIERLIYHESSQNECGDNLVYTRIQYPALDNGVGYFCYLFFRIINDLSRMMRTLNCISTSEFFLGSGGLHYTP